MPGFELIDEEEKNAVIDLFDNYGAVLFAHGFDELRKSRYQVREFEQACAEKFGVKYALAVTSGTAALAVGLKALGVRPGDQVITQAFTFVASVEAILSVGAVPVIVNIDKSLNIDPIELEKKVNKKTKVIMPVHMLGMPADMEAVEKIALENNVKILEDNCESIGAKIGKKYLGSIGDVGVISFDHGKALTTGEGGMILTNSDDVDKFAREYHDHGHENNPSLPRGKDSKSIWGFNYRMTEIQAVIGKVQLKKLNKLLAENKKRYVVLEENLADHFELRQTVENSSGQNDCYIFRVQSSLQRREIMDILTECNFGTKNLPDAIEWHCAYYWDHIFNKEEIADLEKSKKILEEYIAIPITVSKSLEQYNNVANLIVNVIAK